MSTGQLLRVLPRTLVIPALVGNDAVRARAALAYAGEGAAISHLSALRVWGLPVPDDRSDGFVRPGEARAAARGVVDVVVAHRRRPRAGTEPQGGAAGGERVVRVRRSRHTPEVRVRSGLAVVTLERAVVESWPLLVADAQRAPAVVAVRRRLTTAARLRRELGQHRRLPGRRALHELLDLIELGCHSELELWGYTDVFTGPRFAALQRQVRLPLLGRTAHLDLYDEEAVLDIELDGREHHDSPRDRERDLARDAAVAETGRLTVRFPHRRLVSDPEGCREQAWRVIVVRRTQLRGPAHPTGDAQPR